MNPGLASSASTGAAGLLTLLLRTNTRQAWRRLTAIRDQSHLLTATILVFVGGYVVLSFFLFHRGLRFLGTFPGLGALLVERLLFLLFGFLFMLLLFSNLVISYTNLFRNRESAFLLTLPVPATTIFRWKFLESTVLASWAFLFLVAPLLGAYGMSRHAPWHFYPMTVLLISLFIVLPAVAGSWIAVNLARYLDRRAFQVAALTIAVGTLVAVAIWLKPEPVTDESLETRVLAVMDRLLVKTRFVHFPLLPSYWLSSGVLHWSEGAWASAGFFLLVLLSYVLFFGTLAFVGMGGIFYDAASTVQSRGSVFSAWKWFQAWHSRRIQHPARAGSLEKLLQALFWVRADARALVVKDIRIFWRDTTQWGQSIMLFGLLGIYILNLRHFSHQSTHPFWTNLVAFLNLTACSLNLATLTTRFVFPQFSLEGKRVWIVGMAPLGLPHVVKIKFWLSTLASLAVTLGLILLSCHMLRLPTDRTLYFAVAVTVMTFALNGLAVGLGVLYPNFKEDNPSKIVSGFGGTFCLVLSFVYILGSAALLALGSPWTRLAWQRNQWLWLAWAGFAVLSVLIGWVPLKLAFRKLRQFEM